MPAALCSLSGARTLVETNLVHLDLIDASSLVAALMGTTPKGVPTPLLADVIHEAVHHWCLNTPVGGALALAREQLLEAILSEGSVRLGAALYYRQTYLMELLRPVMEGLACFAEFDAYPSIANLRVDPLLWTSIMAHPDTEFSRQGGQAGEADHIIRETLRELRGDEATARRKDNLLTQPLNPINSGGYLTGYLLVKGLRARVHKRTRLAEDSELWLAFLRAYFLYDIELAQAVLDTPGLEGDNFLEPLPEAGEFFMSRLRELSDPELCAQRLEEYNDAFGEGEDPTRRDQILARALRTSMTAQTSWDRLVDAKLLQLHERSGNEIIDGIRYLTEVQVRTRAWICVATLEGNLVHTDQGPVRFFDQDGVPRVVQGQLVQGAPELTEELVQDAYDGPGSLEYWVGPPEVGSVYVLSSTRGVHACLAAWSQDTQPVASFLRWARSNRQMLGEVEFIDSTVRQFIGNQPWYADLISARDAVLEPALRDQALLATRLFGGGRAATEAMWDVGFFGVFDSAETVQLVSAIGLSDSTSMDMLSDSRPNAIAKLLVDGLKLELRLADIEKERLLI